MDHSLKHFGTGMANKHLETILQEQETTEQTAYRSSEAIRQMIREDFSNSADILRAISAYPVNLAALFQKQPLASRYGNIPLPVRQCGFFHAAKHTLSQISYLHSHDFYEYIYVLRGEAVQHFGKQEERLCLKAHQSCLLAPGVSHIMERCGQKDVILKFSLSERMFRETVMQHALVEPGEEMTVYEQGNEQTDLYAGRLFREGREWDDYAEEAIKNCLSLLFIELKRTAYRRPSGIVKLLTAFFEENPNETSLQKFAAYAGYSPDHAGRLVKSGTGKTFGEYMRDRRLFGAAKMLVETEHTIEFIASASGYATTSGFYKQFYRLYAMSPGAYRKTFSAGRSRN